MTSAADRLGAIAGVVDFRDPTAAALNCRILISSDGLQTESSAPAAFAVSALTPRWSPRIENPRLVSNRYLLLVGDARVDNRTALLDALGIRANSTGLSDCQLILHAWQRWGSAAPSRLRGDFAFAVWSRESEELQLVRGPLSASQLFYCSGQDWIAFSSTAQALTRLQKAKLLDLNSAAQFVAGIPSPGQATFFSGVKRLRHGHRLKVRRGSVVSEAFWIPTRHQLSDCSERDLAVGLRDHLDSAVSERIGRSHGLVAAELSSGRDSGAVATAAADILGQRRAQLIAFTAAPQPRFEGADLIGRLDDESVVAGATAARYANIKHIVVRARGDPFAGVADAHSVMPNPLPHITNFSWGSEILRQAAEAGATVLLNADLGNFGISGGGVWHLASVLREEGITRWWNVARLFLKSAGDVPRVLNWTFGGRTPAWVHREVRKAFRRQSVSPRGLRLLREPFRSQVTDFARAELADVRPPADAFAFRADMLMAQDPSNAIARLFGIDSRDPTADRDLIDFCFGIPTHLLLGPGDARPLFEAAFAGRMDPQQLRPLKRGYQGADWYLNFTPEIVLARLAEWRGHACVSELIDLEYVDRLLASWPRKWSHLGQMLHYRNDLLGVLSFANYVAVNF